MLIDREDELKKLTSRVLGAAMEVHSILGPGYLESVYEESLAQEFEIRDIPYERQKTINLSYKGHKVGESRLDFLVDDILIVELKAVEQISPIHTAQVLSYLKTTGLYLGIVINFNVVSLKSGIKRVIKSSNYQATP
ncbi:GxxExxY protein [Dendrosporobacter sp. 1207_IL3150]|uniref:GxxExxY protein n=1 Tax=Dendrosporobacter sp. 1207_IL3150 TaxID=3084054 RepID=UPI002FD92086